jgi:hypothetical protein
MPAALDVPAPTLQFAADASGAAPLEQPVRFALGPVLRADGTPAAAAGLQRIGAFVYRTSTADGGEEVWNEAALAWQPAPADPAALDAMTPLPLVFKDGQAQPWQGVWVAAGQKDGAGAPRYAPAVGGLPAYRLRAVARFADAGRVDAGTSAASADLRFVSLTDGQRLRISFDTGSASDCRTVRIALRNADRVVTGYLDLHADGPTLELATCDPSGIARASIAITADGDIALRPAPGRRVTVQGDVEVGHLRYQPVAGGPPRDL